MPINISRYDITIAVNDDGTVDHISIWEVPIEKASYYAEILEKSPIVERVEVHENKPIC